MSDLFPHLCLGRTEADVNAVAREDVEEDLVDVNDDMTILVVER